MKEYFLSFSNVAQKGFRKKRIVITIVIAFALVLVSCSNQDMDSTDYGSIPNIDSIDGSSIQVTYKYPQNPVTELKCFLENDIIERGLPLELGDIEQVEWDRHERMEFTIHFKNDSENACVVSFITKSNYSFYDYALDGDENPSFTIAFKDPDKSQDMIIVLTSVILYLSPDIGLKEAERLAVKQDGTISIDGYSIPQDIGSYQVQSHYTNPHVYFTTKDFTAKLGVTITALKKIWGGEINTKKCQKLSSSEEFLILNKQRSLFDDTNYTSKTVYADFIVKDWWQHEDYLHGDIETWVMVESPYGKEYLLRLDPMRTPYEFGIGEKYSLFITYHIRGISIFYAIQLTR